MTGLEIAAEVVRSIAFVVFYFIIGFGPGFVAGILLANGLLGRGKPIIMEKQKEAQKLAAQHNAQWNPSHERWHQ